MHLQCTLSSTFDWEVRRLGMRERVKTRIWIFLQKFPFDNVDNVISEAILLI